MAGKGRLGPSNDSSGGETNPVATLRRSFPMFWNESRTSKRQALRGSSAGLDYKDSQNVRVVQ